MESSSLLKDLQWRNHGCDKEISQDSSSRWHPIIPLRYKQPEGSICNHSRSDSVGEERQGNKNVSNMRF